MPGPVNPETGSPYPSLSVLQLQKALEIAHQQDGNIVSPGVIDGLWGQNTSASFTSWQHQQDSRLGTTELAFPISARSRGPVYLYPATHAVLYSLAEIYDASNGTSQQPTPGAMRVQNAPTLAPVAPGFTFLGQPWWVWLLIGLGAAGVGGGLWWYYAKKQRR